MSSSRLYPSAPIPGVGAVVWRGGQVLLVRRANPPRQGSWTLPGGAQDLGETVFEAARREVLEETGVECEVTDLAAVVDIIDRDEDGQVRYHYTIIDVTAEWRGGEAVAGDDASDVAWASPEEFDAYGLDDKTRRVIALASVKRRTI
ncbi:NUDIX hydrolase [Telmatospirillum sp. J64-1]|uniref:NUDIX hydrolase n=1 Tax=Telmatospirillum sp. J64-1 TaxID=2502183 RepID=UPI00115C8829|nr:NUDIX hydrolase [Telmatospirillum sp. J64-1]